MGNGSFSFGPELHAGLHAQASPRHAWSKEPERQLVVLQVLSGSAASFPTSGPLQTSQCVPTALGPLMAVMG